MTTAPHRRLPRLPAPCSPTGTVAKATVNQQSEYLLFVSLGLVVDDGEVSQLVSVAVAGDDVQVVAELLLLEVLLREVLEVALRERRLCSHGDARLRGNKAIFFGTVPSIFSNTRKAIKICQPTRFNEEIQFILGAPKTGLYFTGAGQLRLYAFHRITAASISVKEIIEVFFCILFFSFRLA